MVSDVNETVKWYQDNFNFKLANKVGSLDDVLEWAAVKDGEVELFFQQKNSLLKEMPVLDNMKIGATLTLYIKTNDIQSLYDSVKEKVDIIREMKETFYGAKEFGVKDLNGYILVFSEIKE